MVGWDQTVVVARMVQHGRRLDGPPGDDLALVGTHPGEKPVPTRKPDEDGSRPMFEVAHPAVVAVPTYGAADEVAQVDRSPIQHPFAPGLGVPALPASLDLRSALAVL